MTPDPALAWLIEDAKSQGLTFSEYERRYGIILEMPRSSPPAPAELMIRRHEIAAGLVTDGDVALAASKARRRSG